jgi:hypothetical protein
MYLIGNQPFGKPYVKTNQNSSRPAKTNMAPTAEPKGLESLFLPAIDLRNCREPWGTSV